MCMKAERRTIIVREIEHWRRSKLLPDHYCDFLINLYADPVAAPKSEVPDHIVGKAIMAVSNATGKQWFLTFGIFTLISFVVLYFSVFHIALQIALILVGTGLLLWLGERIRVNNPPMGFLTITLGHLLFLCGGLFIIHDQEYTEWYWNGGLIVICSLIWIVYGIKQKLSALHFVGWLAFLLSYSLLLHQLTAAQEWYEVQLYWMPLAILYGWVSWFIHRFSKAVAGVMLLTAICTWFMPELFQFMFIDQTDFIHLQLIAKMITGGLTLFLLRKQWMVWVI